MGQLLMFNETLETALRLGALTPHQAWMLMWDGVVHPNDPIPPENVPLLQRMHLANVEPVAPMQ